MGAGNDTALWSLPVTLSASDLPGRLVMQNDGNLVFYSRNNKALWATDTGNASGASSKLILTGTYDSNSPDNSTVILQVYNYSDMTVSSEIYN